MPTISRFFGIVIAMFFDDHEPPHFSRSSRGGSIKVRIDPVAVIDGTLGRRQRRLVLAWAELHQDELLENWRLALRAAFAEHEGVEVDTQGALWPPLDAVLELGDPNRDAIVKDVRMVLTPPRVRMLIGVIECEPRETMPRIALK